jgi:hypothetical protein
MSSLRLKRLTKVPEFNSDIIIGSYPSARTKIEAYLNKFLQETNLHIRVVETPEASGSADVLRAVRDKIKVDSTNTRLRTLIQSDFIVLSCDVVTDVKPHVIINHHALRGSCMYLSINTGLPSFTTVQSSMETGQGQTRRTILASLWALMTRLHGC